ncbi:MAG: hypothetical protein AB8F74_20545 [Saprospiraceae bacterium]
MKTSTLRKKTLPYFLIGILFFAYVCTRAAHVGITFDESSTLGVFVPQSLAAIYSYFSIMANNHWLNTLAIKSLYAFTGIETILVARLPNLSAMLFFLYYLFRICNENLRQFWGYFLYLIILLNPFLLDFFGLARGYGLAIAFMTGSLFHLINYTKEKKEKHALTALGLAVFSVLSNFTYLLFFGAVYLTIHLIIFSERKKRSKYFLLILNVFSLFTVLLVYYPLNKLRTEKALWYGGIDNFYTDTLYTLTDSSMGFSNNSTLVFVVLNSFLIMFFIAFIFSKLFNKKENHFSENPSTIIFSILLICIFSNITLHFLFGFKYLIHRTALMYFPLFMMALVFLINDNKEKYSSLFLQISMTILLIGSVINFQNHYNYYTTITWFYDAPVTKALDYINEKGKAENKIFILDSTVLFKGSLQYYHWKRKYKHVVYIKEQPDNLDKSLADYFLYLEKPLSDLDYNPKEEQVAKYKRPRVLHFEKEGVVLLSNLRRTQRGSTSHSKNY